MDAEPRRPIVWSIAGNDSGGGAGLSADQRAAEAFGAHLCPVVAAVTAQNSVGVTRVEPMAPDLLEAQLAALFDDMPPAAVKTGLLGSADNVVRVARWIDRLRARDPRVALVVDPVLGASTGAAFADEAVLRAYVEWLLPRATIVTPNEREARRLAATSPEARAASSMVAIAQGLRAAGAQAVAITGGDDHASHGLSLDWIDTGHASGWLALPRIDTPHSHGTGCTFATSAAGALALGFVPADALVLAKMATTQALRQGHAAGQGAGPVAARAGFADDPALLPCLSWGDEAIPGCCGHPNHSAGSRVGAAQPDLGIYAIVDSAERVRQVVAAGVKTVQLRIKTPDAPDAPDAAWHAALRDAVSESLAACRAAGATLVVNDHWRLAAELAAGDTRGLAVHLGQEDLLVLGATGRAELAASGLPLGISSHSLWELARARALQPWYVACGPVWPTLTKAMPWVPQGLDNLAWWVHMAGVPVVAIGGILEPEQLSQAARSGASGVCVVRGLGDDPALSLPLWQAALQAGRTEARLPVPRLPHPSLQVAALH
jgi:hydroxymethylpyrimidine kinase/phosphomethylpyrimidine kinase/thiamine-phosphate diphosphorylase